MTSSVLPDLSTTATRIHSALQALHRGQGVMITDAEDRENEGDLIFAAESITPAQMAILIRTCSGIVCLCLPSEKTRVLALPQMVPRNTSRHGTAFTVSIEAAYGVTTGVSAQDRVTTIRAAIAPDARPSDLSRPGHVFPLEARDGGVLERPGHTEAATDLLRIAGLQPYAVLCELMNPDGSMSRLQQVQSFGSLHGYPWLTVADVIAWRRQSHP
jgi:3,4-dihydroxy 2-butanone 4-phosphate synthase